MQWLGHGVRRVAVLLQSFMSFTKACPCPLDMPQPRGLRGTWVTLHMGRAAGAQSHELTRAFVTVNGTCDRRMTERSERSEARSETRTFPSQGAPGTEEPAPVLGWGQKGLLSRPGTESLAQRGQPTSLRSYQQYLCKTISPLIVYLDHLPPFYSRRPQDRQTAFFTNSLICASLCERGEGSLCHRAETRRPFLEKVVPPGVCG